MINRWEWNHFWRSIKEFMHNIFKRYFYIFISILLVPYMNLWKSQNAGAWNLKGFFKIDFNPIHFGSFRIFPELLIVHPSFMKRYWIQNCMSNNKYVYLCIYEKKKYVKNADRFPKMSIFIAVDGRSHDLFACGPEFRLLLSRKVKSKRQNLVQKILKVHISPNF